MGFVKDISGKKFGKLTVISQVTKRGKNREVFWVCICDCGVTKSIQGNHIKSGHTKSCGCIYDPEMNTKHGSNRRGKTTPEYRIWSNMKYRCSNKNYKEYHLYGGRGINVCDRWSNDFSLFLLDMGERPTKNHSIDRINVNGNYEPENCRWVLTSAQQRNRRSNRWISYDGMTMILKEWADYLNVTPQNLHRMLKKKPISDVVGYYKKCGKL